MRDGEKVNKGRVTRTEDLCVHVKNLSLKRLTESPAIVIEVLNVECSLIFHVEPTCDTMCQCYKIANKYSP